MDFNFEFRFTQNLINREASIDVLQELERTILVNTINCNSRFWQILDCVYSSKLTFWNFAHKVDHTFTVSRSIIVELLSINIESESRIAINIGDICNLALYREINSSNHEFWVFSFKFGSKFFIFWGKSDTMSTRSRVVLNKYEFVVFKGRFISLVIQLDNIIVFNFLLLFSLFFIVEFLDFSFTHINQKLSQRLFLITINLRVIWVALLTK